MSRDGGDKKERQLDANWLPVYSHNSLSQSMVESTRGDDFVVVGDRLREKKRGR